jgi:hypothetical protein
MRVKTILIILVAVLAVGGTVAASIAFASRQEPTKLQACKTTGIKHLVVIENGAIKPTHIDGKRCDTMQIVNRDDIAREIGFGNHEHHVAYDGIREKVITKDQSIIVTLVQTGEYHFHDHFHDEIEATFDVTP